MQLLVISMWFTVGFTVGQLALLATIKLIAWKRQIYDELQARQLAELSDGFRKLGQLGNRKTGGQ